MQHILWQLVLVCACSISALSVAQPLPQSAQALSLDQQALHVANRLGYGATPELVRQIKRMGVGHYLDQQLRPKTPTDTALQARLAAAGIRAKDPQQQLYQLAQLYPTTKDPQLISSNAVLRQQWVKQQLADVRRAKLIRAVYSEHQLQAVLTDFWMNHFNVHAQHPIVVSLLSDYECCAIQPHVLGSFEQMLLATAKHPVMSQYLNNRTSVKNSTDAQGRVRGMNENYAREVMELHTLGVNGGYQQTDVKALATLLTGWSFNPKGGQSGASLFVFDPKRHDAQPVTFLGRKLGGQGVQDGEAALKYLAQHPSTARFIAFKLAQYFVADQPPQRLVTDLTQRYLNSRGDLHVVMQTLVYSPEFWDKRYVATKFKTPFEYVVSSVRLIGVDLPNQDGLNQYLQQMGMLSYGRPTPDGYPVIEAEWRSPAALNQRLDFAQKLGHLKIRLNTEAPRATVSKPPLAAEHVLAQIPTLLHPRSAQTIRQAPVALQWPLLLSTPELMYR